MRAVNEPGSRSLGSCGDHAAVVEGVTAVEPAVVVPVEPAVAAPEELELAAVAGTVAGAPAFDSTLGDMPPVAAEESLGLEPPHAASM